MESNGDVQSTNHQTSQFFVQLIQFRHSFFLVLIGVILVPFILTNQTTQQAIINKDNGAYIVGREKFATFHGNIRGEREPSIADRSLSHSHDIPSSEFYQNLEQQMERQTRMDPLPLSSNAPESAEIRQPEIIIPSVARGVGSEVVVPQNKEGKPIIYTFFEQAPEGAGVSIPATNKRQLELWKSFWVEAGWEPIVINMSDARLHPKFQYFANKLEEISFFIHPPVEYNKMCFYRWLAMVVVGGGWMADFDVFPLPKSYIASREQELPNNGDLTIHDMGTHPVPSLVSGSSSEWDRMASTIFKAAANQAQLAVPSLVEGKTSDMLALQAVVASMESKQEVEAVPQIKTEFRVDICERLQEMRGVHFSHQAIYAMANDTSPYAVERRPDLIEEWMKLWKEKCPNHIN